MKPENGSEGCCDTATDSNRMSPQETADLINEMILKSQELLAQHPFNIERAKRGERQANSIWPWSGGYRPLWRH